MLKAGIFFFLNTMDKIDCEGGEEFFFLFWGGEIGRYFEEEKLERFWGRKIVREFFWGNRTGKRFWERK